MDRQSTTSFSVKALEDEIKFIPNQSRPFPENKPSTFLMTAENYDVKNQLVTKMTSESPPQSKRLQLDEGVYHRSLTHIAEYDLVLMMDDEKEIGIQRVEDFLKRNKPFQGKPILIKQGDQFSLYGLSEKGQWQLTHGLNPSSFAGLPFKQWTGEHTSFPPEEEKRIEQLSLITARKDEILRKIQDKGLHSRLEKELEVRLQQIDEIEKGFKKENKGGKEGKAGKEEPTPRDSWSRKKQEQREAALLNKMRRSVPTQTKGGGDCALHAILGEWNPLEHQLVCADMTGKRKQIRTAIESKEHKEPLRGLIVAGIKELVMSGRDIGKASQKLRSHYRRFLSDQKDFSSVLWPRFEADFATTSPDYGIYSKETPAG